MTTLTYLFPAHVNVASFVTMKLSEKNFLLWKQQMLTLIRSQQLEGFIADRIAAPPAKIIGKRRGNRNWKNKRCVWRLASDRQSVEIVAVQYTIRRCSMLYDWFEYFRSSLGHAAWTVYWEDTQKRTGAHWPAVGDEKGVKKFGRVSVRI